MEKAKFRIYGLIGLFLIAISFPFLNDRLSILKDIPNFENRKQALEPEFDVNHLDKFPKPYEEYYNDRFTLRSLFIKWYNTYKLVLFHQSPLPDKFVIGKEGWLFQATEEFDSYMGKNRFTPKELLEFKLELEFRKKYLEEHGCKFYFLIVPCKSSIYSKYIGYEHVPVIRQTWGEQLMEYLNQNCNVKPINCFSSLRAKAETQQLFYKLDNHWNSLGALYAANDVIKVMKSDLQELQEFKLSDFTVKKTEIHSGNIQSMLGNLSMFSDVQVNLIPKHPYKASDVKKVPYKITHGFPYPDAYEANREIKDSKKPRLLVISDSFGAAIFPFLSENFSRSVKIFDGWKYGLNKDIIDAEKPDVVLLMIDEPILKSFLTSQSRLQKN